MNNECYEGNILNAALLEMKKSKCCCPRYIPGPTGPTGPAGGPAGPTARCNKSSIYILNGKVPYYFNIS